MSLPPLFDRIDAVRARGAVIAIGNFDGVHEGHRALLGHARDVADRGGAPFVAVSFFPPAKSLFGGVPYLSTRDEKHELLAELGPAEVVIVPFDHAFASTPAAEFVAALADLAPAAIVVGEDFRFGRGRTGDAEDLGRAAPRVEVLRLVAIDGEVVKSSAVRVALEQGDVRRANRLLGSPYRVLGSVRRGERRGRTIGVPTANLEAPAGKALPRGVFAVEVDLPEAVGGGRHGGMANVGTRPTFDGPPPALEVHLFDWQGDLYDQQLQVRFVAKLRDQVRFDGLEALKAQLERDARAARSLLAARAGDGGPEADRDAAAPAAGTRDEGG